MLLSDPAKEIIGGACWLPYTKSERRCCVRFFVDLSGILRYNLYAEKIF